MIVVELPPLLTIDELATLARESRRTIERRLAAGEIAAVRLGAAGRHVRIPREEAVRYLGLDELPSPTSTHEPRRLR